MSATLNCRDVSRLVSDALDRKLPASQTLEMKMHLFMCKFCSRFKKQMDSIRHVIREHADLIDEDWSQGGLKPETKERIRHIIQSGDQG